MCALYVISRVGRIGDHVGWVYAAQFVKSTGIIVATGYMWALVPEVVSYSEHRTGKRLAGIVTAIMGLFFRAGMALGKILPGVVLALTGYRAAAPVEDGSLPADPSAWFWTMSALAVVAFVFLVFCFAKCRERIAMKESERDKVKLRDLWLEFRGNAPLRDLALFFVLAFTMMSVGNTAGPYFMNGLDLQNSFAQEGVRWLVCVIPAILLVASAGVFSRYPLSDEAVEKLNREIKCLKA